MDGVRLVFFRSALRPQGWIALVEYNDGTIGITRDDQPVDSRRWKSATIADAVREFTTLRRQLNKPGAESKTCPRFMPVSCPAQHP